MLCVLQLEALRGKLCELGVLERELLSATVESQVRNSAPALLSRLLASLSVTYDPAASTVPSTTSSRGARIPLNGWTLKGLLCVCVLGVGGQAAVGHE